MRADEVTARAEWGGNAFYEVEQPLKSNSKTSNLKCTYVVFVSNEIYEYLQWGRGSRPTGTIIDNVVYSLH